MGLEELKCLFFGEKKKVTYITHRKGVTNCPYLKLPHRRQKEERI